ncbi:MAG: hypothetical protein A2Y92_01995 [Chloroflexi bacterium RBG_13_57_8]|nr:MAG: hypothetical protein A2Y92_01995 [Chloroflexi bacterium RBG_13_57_8]
MDKVFNIIPGTSGAITFIWILSAVMVIILLGIIGLLASFGYQARHLTITLNEQGLRISPGLYTRFIPKESIDTANIRVLDLAIDTQYRPRWRTNGAGLPGYNAGWFKLQNKEKALLFVTDKSSVVYIPTTDNYSVILSVINADEFAGLLQNWK